MDWSCCHWSPCVVFTSIMLCSHEPHKLWDTSSFVYYRPHFWQQHLASMVLCETAGKIIFLSPIHCWPFQPAESCIFWCVFQLWSFWPGNISNTSPLEGDCMQHSRPGTLYMAWWCNSDFLHSWCCFSPVEHGSNQSMLNNASTRHHGHDFAAQLSFESSKELSSLLQLSAHSWVLCPVCSWSPHHWKSVEEVSARLEVLEHPLLRTRGTAQRTWAMISAEWCALLLPRNGKFHAHRFVNTEKK